MEITKKYPLIDLVQTKTLSFWVYNNYAYVYKSYLESYLINDKWEFMGDYQKKPILDSSLEVWKINNIYYIQNDNFNWVDEVYYEKSSPIEIWNYSEYAINCFSARYDLKISELPFDNDEIYNIKIFYKFENLEYYPNSEQLDLLVKDYLKEIEPDWGIQYSSKDSIVMDKNRVYHFFDYHFKLYKGNCYDFINHCDKIINEVWKVESSQNLKSQKYFDEWKTEKVVEYGLDRSKLNLEQKTTPEPTQQENITVKNTNYYPASYTQIAPLTIQKPLWVYNNFVHIKGVANEYFKLKIYANDKTKEVALYVSGHDYRNRLNDFFEYINKNTFTDFSVSPQLTPSFHTSIDLRPLSKIKYTHDKGN